MPGECCPYLPTAYCLHSKGDWGVLIDIDVEIVSGEGHSAYKLENITYLSSYLKDVINIFHQLDVAKVLQVLHP